MPSFPRNQFADLEEMMCKQLMNLDLREQTRSPPSLGDAMRPPGCVGRPLANASFSLSSLSCLPADPSDAVFLSADQWGGRPESPLPARLIGASEWAKSGFLAQRSLSMVETGSAAAAGLAWPDAAHSQSDTGSSSSPSPGSSSSSSSRYKTELCRSFTESGLCKYGGKCQFAHGLDELRDLNRHPKYKTEPCRTFHTVGFCPYGIRCHFVHNNEEEELKLALARSSSSSGVLPPPPPCFRPQRPPLVRQSFSFAGFPSAPLQLLPPALPVPFARAPSASPPLPPPPLPSCADITDLLSHAFLEMDSAFEASPAHLYPPPIGPAAAATDPPSPFLPSPDSGCSPSGLSPAASPPPRRSPGAGGAFPGPLGARSPSYASLSDPEQDGGGSSASSLSGSESTDASGRRLAVFSQLSVPEDAAAGLCL
ncbi:Zinc finger protein 36, C3H1 type-like 1 [Liparis tanakae]|uniref:mRNA decay activator protein ZFP36 n=1 Tax=Liparis tanakae TaxID=230148 RepID=A0A4Z2EXA7_9TELE|nr:Zinc finger protein 36, C3H1 type-like 1 [Liparis tanakae]